MGVASARGARTACLYHGRTADPRVRLTGGLRFESCLGARAVWTAGSPHFEGPRLALGSNAASRQRRLAAFERMRRARAAAGAVAYRAGELFGVVQAEARLSPFEGEA